MKFEEKSVKELGQKSGGKQAVLVGKVSKRFKDAIDIDELAEELNAPAELVIDAMTLVLEAEYFKRTGEQIDNIR